MKIKYFEDTGTLYIEFREVYVAGTQDMDENTLVDFDAQGQVCGSTVEHARERAEIHRSSYEQIAA